MPYKLPPRIRLDVPEEIGDGLWVDIRNPAPGALPWAVSKAIGAAQKRAKEAADFGAVDEIAVALVVDWNLPDPDVAGGVLPLPSKDPKVMDRVPTAIVNLVINAWAKRPEPDIDPNS